MNGNVQQAAASLAVIGAFLGGGLGVLIWYLIFSSLGWFFAMLGLIIGSLIGGIIGGVTGAEYAKISDPD